MIANSKSGLWEYAENRRNSADSQNKSSSSLKARLEQIRSQSDRVSAESLANPWIQAASVLAVFNPAKIKSVDGARPEKFEEFAAVLQASQPIPASGGMRTLELLERRRHLSHLASREAMKIALIANSPDLDLPVQRGFEILLNGDNAFREVQRRGNTELLAGISEALLWVEGILEKLPDRDDLKSELAVSRVTQPLHDLIGPHFSGREDALNKMLEYFDEPVSEDNILYLHGPGGVGKSTVLAKFAIDLQANQAIDLLVYLNFDRPTLNVREPLTVLSEMINQMAAQLQLKELEILQREIESYMFRFAHGREALESISDGGGGWQNMIAGVARAIRKLPGDGPFLVLIDTFERAQKFGESVVREFWRMLRILGKEAPRLRIIAAGRVDSYGMFQNAYKLEGLKLDKVGNVLEAICIDRPPKALIQDVAEATDGRPLGVRLAGLLFKRIGLEKLKDPTVRSDALIEVRSEQAEAVLYNRVLGQISDPQVRELARWGLLLRHITEGIIENVISPSIEPKLSPADGSQMYYNYTKEVDLVQRGFAEWGEPMLTHRADVRNLMLDDLRSSAPSIVSKIDELAVEYFGSLNGAMARSEEIYHRLWLDESIETIEERWTNACIPYLIDAIQEIPRNYRPWLANKVGVDLPPEFEGEADQIEWETFALRAVNTALNRGSAEQAIEILSRRKERLPGSALFTVEADALSRLGQFDRAREVVDRGLASAAQAGFRNQAAELWLVRSIMYERGRKFAASGRDANRALRIAEDLQLFEMSLRTIASLLRLRRKSRNIEGPQSELLVNRAIDILDQKGDNVLVKYPFLMQALAAELGPKRPQLLALTVRKTGRDTIGTPNPEVQQVIHQATMQLAKPKFGAVADIVNKIDPETAFSFDQSVGRLIKVAEERDMLAQVSVPIARVLAAEVDQLTGSFPAPSMARVELNHAWWKDEDIILKSKFAYQ